MYYRHNNATKQLDHPMKWHVQLRVQQHTIFMQSEQKPWQAYELVECYGLMQNLKFWSFIASIPTSSWKNLQLLPIFHKK